MKTSPVKTDWHDHGESVMLLQGPEAVRFKLLVFRSQYGEAAAKAFEKGARAMGFNNMEVRYDSYNVIYSWNDIHVNHV